jgi:uncharacterized membrane protein
MTDAPRLSSDPFWQRLADHERDQFQEYVELVMGDPEAICDAFNPDRRREFMRLLAKGLGISSPDI